ncbi:MAG TPA: methylmalonyl-CoA mutase subunit beta [Mycobacteriales bacterium]|nr:methylmalonyl-CoA mutase subunit beta [Mycobacteriales bacterium]
MTDVSGAEDLVLAAEFPAASREKWLALVAKVVGVEDPRVAERELTTELFADVETAPLYVSAGATDLGLPGQAPFVRGRTSHGSLGGWDVRVRHDHPVAATAHDQILEDLEGGASSLWLGVGTSAIGVDSLAEVLDAVFLELITVALDPGPEFVATADRYLAVADDRGLGFGELSVRFGADPIGLEAASGSAGDLAAAVELAGRSSREFPNARALTVDALPFHLAGADDAQEIGCSLAVGAEYLRGMRAAGLDADAAFGELEFRYAATADQFLTIAKLRAARQTWSSVAQSCGVTGPSAGQLQHAVSSPAMQTQRDPWNNILRGTLAAFSAGVGGADAITVAPFDAAIGYSDRLARRVARNTHALLVEESNVARTIDPAGGSWYVEQLTADVARRAWRVFQTIERAGGALAALRSGALDAELATSRDARLTALAHRSVPITGVTEFPNAEETLLARDLRPEAPVAGLPRLRWAQSFEASRDRSDAYAAANGEPPTVTTAKVGDPKQSGMRLSAVTAALASGGIRTETSNPGAASRAVAVVGIAEDAAPEDVHAEVERLRGAGAQLVIERAAGDLDVLALHEQVLAALGVPS